MVSYLPGDGCKAAKAPLPTSATDQELRAPELGSPVRGKRSHGCTGLAEADTAARLQLHELHSLRTLNSSSYITTSAIIIKTSSSWARTSSKDTSPATILLPAHYPPALLTSPMFFKQTM